MGYDQHHQLHGWCPHSCLSCSDTMQSGMQATKLRNQLVEQKIPEEALWVTSPLTRAIDTLILACPQPHRLGPPPLAEAGLNASTSQQSRPLKLVVRRSASMTIHHYCPTAWTAAPLRLHNGLHLCVCVCVCGR